MKKNIIVAIYTAALCAIPLMAGSVSAVDCGPPQASVTAAPSGDQVVATVTSNHCNNGIEAYGNCSGSGEVDGGKVFTKGAQSFAECPSAILREFGYRYHQGGIWHYVPNS